MKTRKSTIILVVVILVTVLLGAAAVYTSYLLRQREKVAEEEAEAAVGTYCGPLTFTVEESQTGIVTGQNKFRIVLNVKNERTVGGSIYLLLRPLISQCADACSSANCDTVEDYCSDWLLLGDDSSSWEEVTVVPGSTEQLTFVADTAYPETCGRFQYDIVVLDVKEGSSGGGRIDECNIGGWAATDVVDAGEECYLCEVEADSSTISPGGTVGLTASSMAPGVMTLSPWQASVSGGSFSPTSGYETTYTAPSTLGASEVTFTFAGSSETFPRYLDPQYGTGHNALRASDLESPYTMYLPGVANKKTDDAATDRTRIFIYNPNSSSVTATVNFKDTGGSQIEATKSVTVAASGTAVVDTRNEFDTSLFYGSAEVTASSPLMVSYEKIGAGGNRAWGMEGIPSAGGGKATTLYLDPVTDVNMNWGAKNHYITVYNPNSSSVNLTYDFFYTDHSAQRELPSHTTTLAANKTYTIDINDYVPDTDPVDPNNIYWWTGSVKITSGGGSVVAISEDIGENGASGSIGYFGRGRSTLYAPSTQMCLLPMVVNIWGLEKTGYGFAHTDKASSATSTIRYYGSDTGKEVCNVVMESNYTNGGFHRDTQWACDDASANPPYKSLGNGYQGAAIVSSSTEVVGGVQDLSESNGEPASNLPSGWDKETFGRGTLGVPCDSSFLSNSKTLYLTGLQNGVYGTRTASIGVFNPNDSVSQATIDLYDDEGNNDASVDIYLKPKAMGGLVLQPLVPPGWYGSAKITVTSGGGVVAVSQSISDDTLDSNTVTCSTSVSVEGEAEGFDCSLSIDPTTVAKGGSTSADLTITDSTGDSPTYSISWEDDPDTGSYSSYDDAAQRTQETEVTNIYTVDSATTESSTTLSATVSKTSIDQTSVTCDATLAFTGAGDDDTGDDDTGDDDGTGGTGAGTGTQPDTAFFSPVIGLAGTGALFTTGGYVVARNRKKVAGLIRKVLPKKFEEKVLSDVAKKRKKAVEE